MTTPQLVAEALRRPPPDGGPSWAQHVTQLTMPLSANAMAVLERRYLARSDNDVLNETPDDMFRRVAADLAEAERQYVPPETSTFLVENTQEWFYYVMSTLQVLPNSPTLMNAGRPLQQLSACFVLPVDDSIDSIFDQVKRTAIIHKSGGGTGFDFSRLRPQNAHVGSTSGIASGPVSFMSAFDTATDVVKQGGTRRGANMGILRVDHPDILQFIDAKRDQTSLQNFNISVAVTDRFMEAVAVRGPHLLVDPTTDSIVDTLDAYSVLERICEAAHATGDPGLVFIDRIDRDNPNPQLGRIESTNPCGEQPLLPYESCNLASVNLALMVDYAPEQPTVHWPRLRAAVNTAVRLLDNVIDQNEYPIPEIAAMTRRTRRIGLGIMGWADLLIQLGIPYDSDEAHTLLGQLLHFIRTVTHEASRALACARGAFPAFADSTYRDGAPMRNSAPTTIAPTGTISIIAGVSSGIEPLYAVAYERHVMDGTVLPELHPMFEAVARQNDFWTPDLPARIVAAGGSIQHLEDIPEWVRGLFVTAHDISPANHVRTQAIAQQHVDNAVSKTVNLPHEATVYDILNAYLLAYDLGCKGVTVYRDHSKPTQVLNTSRVRFEAGLIDEPAESAPAKQPRPRAVSGTTTRVRTGHGNMYVTVNTHEGRPFEVFASQGKAGGCESAQIEAVSRLVSLLLRSGVSPESITAQLEGLTCCPIWDNSVLVRSAPDAIALVLNDDTPDEPPTGADAPSTSGPRCPDCGWATTNLSGCQSCTRPACGWSRCG